MTGSGLRETVVPCKDVEHARLRRDQAVEAVNAARIEASEASARSTTASKDEKVDAARAAAEARAKVAVCNTALRDAAKALAKAESVAEKRAKDTAKAAASEKRARAKEGRRRLAANDPFLADEINWPALGAWLAARAADRICFVDGFGWGQWVGSHWEFSEKPQASLLDLVRAAYCDRASEVVTRLNANPKSAIYMLEHAQGALTLSRHLFNSPKVAHLVAFRNTAVDLRTGHRVPNSPMHYMTGSLQCDYDEKADLQRVVTAFARFWPNDPDTARMFQTAVGYSATGEVSAKRNFFMVGNQEASLSNGDNGKSMVQNALVRLFGLGLGGLGTAVKSAIILDTGDRDANSHDGAKTPLVWRRFAISTEFRHGASIDAGEFNRISGGDVQSIRPPFGQRAFEFVNVASMWFSMNTVPRFKAWDKATRVRLTPFPFTETFYDPGRAPAGCQEKELGLKEWLESDHGMRAVGLYAVRGAMRFYAHNGGKAGNFPDSPAVSELRDQILKVANPFAELFENWFVFSPQADTTKSAISALLGEHLGARPKGHEKDLFVAALKGEGVTEVKINGIRSWRGVGLSAEGRRVAASRGHRVADVWRGDPHAIAAE